MATEEKQIPVELALQGGGAHGAFTWGVLDRLLEEERLSIRGISGASAGAMNAVVLADGYAAAGRAGAQRALWSFWKAVGRATHIHPFRRTPFDQFFAGWSAVRSPFLVWYDAMSRFFSPSQLNPLDLNPLKEILVRTVDFQRLRNLTDVRLFIAATEVRSGRLRLFRNADLSADVVMASACLPMLFRAVQIEGEAYWDGGYAGNPPLLPLLRESKPKDLLIVQINPTRREAIPSSAQDIMGRLNEITFNASLLKEMRALALLKDALRMEGRGTSDYRSPLLREIAELRLHRIDASEAMCRLDPSSKLNPEWEFLVHLHGVGRRAADAWLQRHGSELGRRSSLDLAEYL